MISVIYLKYFSWIMVKQKYLQVKSMKLIQRHHNLPSIKNQNFTEMYSICGRFGLFTFIGSIYTFFTKVSVFHFDSSS